MLFSFPRLQWPTALDRFDDQNLGLWKGACAFSRSMFG